MNKNNERKNLEAINETYKGLIRTPFSFLIGGPVGLVVNTIYSLFKVKHEIKREKEFQGKMANVFAPNSSYEEKKNIFENTKKHIKENDNELCITIKNDYYTDCLDMSIYYNCCSAGGNTSLGFKKYMNKCFRFMPYNSVVDGVYFPMKQINSVDYFPEKFFEEIQYDDSINNIGEKYYYTNSSSYTFLYQRINAITEKNDERSWVSTSIYII